MGGDYLGVGAIESTHVDGVIARLIRKFSERIGHIQYRIPTVLWEFLMGSLGCYTVLVAADSICSYGGGRSDYFCCLVVIIAINYL